MGIQMPLQSNTLSSQVKHYILDMIAQQQLTPGMAVPSEIKLIEELGVSRGVIREAYRSLSALGILEIKSGKVPRVKAFDSSVLQLIFGFSLASSQVSVSQILSVRRWLEIGSAGMAAANGTEEDFLLLKAEMEQLAATIFRPGEFIQHDINFHLIIARASGNPLFGILLQSLYEQLRLSVHAGLEAQSETHEKLNHIVALHQTICDCVCARDGAGAMKAMTNHFDTAVNSLIEKGEQIQLAE
ncbi:FadR family transcriptional regulator [Enterobacteriaceae bacterium H11S18]|uniref:FadR/GntR family transcriptional regulator n=1 Tax=Dryocola clanedunensis TaxID=2925396 RepID=UPI0022F085B9|nr:FadR/GntR family transcriptional regulator [Dryocola clanedunensis]MCT4706506.1 FadR family transcriptional regulator [Dryocola clanedunensis]MCT4713317.1 FadR family transcriptional regulator [Dryocola clanedunensis]